MSSSETDQVLADERSAEQQYNAFLKERSETRVEISTPRNAIMTQDRLARTNYPQSGQLIGRVRLAGASGVVDGAEDFYIGTSHGRANGVEVFSWRAPVACTFYRGRDHHSLCEYVVGVRTLGHESNTVAQFDDEPTAAEAPTPLFRRGVFTVPRTAPRTPVPAADRSTPRLLSVDVPEPPAVSVAPQGSPSKTGLPSKPHETGPFIGLRAAPILLQKLAAPKNADLSPVLSTLQPDQYDAITRSATDSVIFQGHPGTGKTIIAAHRLAYLTNPEARERKANGLVMLIGPTREYAQHVQPAVSSLVGNADEDVIVSSLPALLDELAGIRDDPHGDTRTDDPTLAGDEIVPYLAATFSEVRGMGQYDELDRPAAVRLAYERLRVDPAFPGGRAMDSSWYRYLRALPPFEEARSIVNLRTVLAYFGIRFRKPAWFVDIAHVVVDEAQDVHPIEWEILGRLGPRQGWTILGDLNQRRTELTYRSWKPVATKLGIENEGHAPIEILDRGYRSTSSIMRYANQLLPRADRGIRSLRGEGVEPKRVRAAQRDKLPASAVGEAISLLNRMSGGSVAIIAGTTPQIMTALRQAGWSTQSEGSQVWIGPEGAIRLLSHDQARGLEFDGVVVVEPADFPKNEGRLGSLYTSLTRANKELVVVNHRALPDALRL
jgi:DNA helicase-2/ATP-dependent DNA helicase PcrA